MSLTVRLWRTNDYRSMWQQRIFAVTRTSRNASVCMCNLAAEIAGWRLITFSWKTRASIDARVLTSSADSGRTEVWSSNQVEWSSICSCLFIGSSSDEKLRKAKRPNSRLETETSAFYWQHLLNDVVTYVLKLMENLLSVTIRFVSMIN